MIRAFTLVELLMVVAIIAILSGLSLAGAMLVRERARHAQAEQMIAQLHQALDNYRSEDLRHAFPAPLAPEGPWLRRDPSGAGDEVLDLLESVGFTYDPGYLGAGDGEVHDCLHDPWRRPFRYQVDDARGVAIWKPAVVDEWNSSGMRPFAYVWSIGPPQGSDDGEATAASRWILLRGARIR